MTTRRMVAGRPSATSTLLVPQSTVMTQRTPRASQLGERRRVQPIPLGHAVGDVGDHRRTRRAQAAHQHGAGGHAICVVVTVDRDRAALIDRRPDCPYRLLHRRQPEWIVEATSFFQESGCRGKIEAPRREHLSDDRMEAV